jgi:hypothetical protein
MTYYFVLVVKLITYYSTVYYLEEHDLVPDDAVGEFLLGLTVGLIIAIFGSGAEAEIDAWLACREASNTVDMHALRVEIITEHLRNPSALSRNAMGEHLPTYLVKVLQKYAS